MEPTSLASKSLDQACVTGHPRTVGLVKSQNGIQQENKRPDWDYVIPICLCNQEKCNCITKTSMHRDKMENGLKTLHKGKTEESRKPLPTSHEVKDKTGSDQSQNPPQPSSKNIEPNNRKHLKEKPALDKNSDTDASSPLVNARPSIPDKILTNENNLNLIPQSASGQVQEQDHPEQRPLYLVAKPKPVPRKPFSKARGVVLAHQGKVEDEKEEFVCQEERGVKVREIKLSLEGKSSSSPSVSVLANEKKQPARKAGAPPAPPPEKKPFLSNPGSAPQDVVEEDLGWDSNIYEMEVSVDEQDKDLEEEDRNVEEKVSNNLAHHSVSSFLPSQPKLSQATANATAAEETRATQELPLPPEEKKSRKLAKTSATKSSRSSLNKAKSFSGADVVRSQVQKKTSFRKLLDLKLAVQQRRVKGRQSPDFPENHGDEQGLNHNPEEHQRVAEEPRDECKLSLPLMGVEQSVDEDVVYENISLYEDISEVGKAESSPTAWDSDEGIYEVPIPYVPSQNYPEQQQQYPTQTYDR